MTKRELPFDDADDALSDALAQALLPARRTPPQLLRERLLGTIARPRLRYAPFYDALQVLFDLNDSELSNIFERAESRSEWLAAPIPGVWLLHLQGGPRAAGADSGLVRIRAGAVFPEHRHRGVERALVLEGGYRDMPSGRVFRAGDAHEMAAGSAHFYVASEERDLLLAVSVVGGVEVGGAPLDWPRPSS
jgi:quercetin dioxygenase-like cupin family protein